MYKKFEYQNTQRFTDAEVPTVFKGVAHFGINGECTIEQIFIDGVEYSPIPIMGTTLYSSLVEAAYKCCGNVAQKLISLPVGNILDSTSFEDGELNGLFVHTYEILSE